MKKLLAASTALAVAAPRATPGLSVRPRGVRALRADASGTEILNEMKTIFSQFKEKNDERLNALEKKISDGLENETVEKINAEIDKLQDAYDAAAAKLAALSAGGGSGDADSPERKAYKKAFNSWFRKGDRAVQDLDMNELAVKAAMSTDSDPDGGYVVPDEMTREITRVQSTVSAMRQLATVISIGSSVYKKPINLGGAGSGWVGEKEARPETDSPTLAMLEFPAMELYANPAATQAMLDDAYFNVEQWLGGEVGIVFAEQEGSAFITGNGVNKPRGIIGYDTVADASYEWGKLGFVASGVAAALNDATHDGFEGLIDLTYALKQGYRTNAGWLMNRQTTGKIRKLKALGDTQSYLWQPPVQAGEPATILGYPTRDDDNMQNVGANAFPIAFGDFKRGYLIVDRVGVRVLRDPFTNKPYVLFYTTKRVGGGVQNFEAIKLYKIAA